MLLGAAAGLLMMGATGASADMYTPSSEFHDQSRPSAPPTTGRQPASAPRIIIVVIPTDGDYAFVEDDQAQPCRSASKRKSPPEQVAHQGILHHDRPRADRNPQARSACAAVRSRTSTSTTMPIASTLAPKKHVDMDAWWTAERRRQQSRQQGAQCLPQAARRARRPRVSSMTRSSRQDRDTKMSIGFRYVARVGHKNDNHDVNESGAPRIQWKQSQPSYADHQRDLPQGSRPLRRQPTDPTPSRPAATILPWVSR